MRKGYAKRLFTFMLVWICSISLTINCFAAENLGEITSMKDSIIPDGENGKIITEITVRTDAEGKMAFPCYEDAELKNLTVLQGTLKEKVVKIEQGSITYYEALFEEKEAEVKLHVEWAQEGTYELKEAKTKGTAPGRLKAVKYTMKNTAPIAIAQYQVDIAMPEGYEMFSIVDYDPEEEYEIYTNQGYKFGHHVFGEIEAGDEAKLTINLAQTKGTFMMMTWGLVILISAFFLYKNRGMLKEAKELAAKKRQEEKEEKAK